MKSKSNGRSMIRAHTSLLRALAVGAFLSISLSACVLIHSSTIGQTTGSGAPVSAVDSDYGILYLSKPHGLTSAANADLVRQCQSGLLTDVQTQLSMRDWFLIVQYYTVAANAVCMPPPPPPPPPPPLPAATHIVLRGVHFDFNKYNIRAEDAAVLDEAAATLKGNPNMVVDVNGYCDWIGGVEYNLRLSQRRAEAVVNYLERDGIVGRQAGGAWVWQDRLCRYQQNQRRPCAEPAGRVGSRSINTFSKSENGRLAFRRPFFSNLGRRPTNSRNRENAREGWPGAREGGSMAGAKKPLAVKAAIART